MRHTKLRSSLNALQNSPCVALRVERPLIERTRCETYLITKRPLYFVVRGRYFIRKGNIKLLKTVSHDYPELCVVRPNCRFQAIILSDCQFVLGLPHIPHISPR